MSMKELPLGLKLVVTYTAGWNLHGSGEALLRLGVALGDAWIGSWQCFDSCRHGGSLTSGDGKGEAQGDSNGGEIHDGSTEWIRSRITLSTQDN